MDNNIPTNSGLSFMVSSSTSTLLDFLLLPKVVLHLSLSSWRGDELLAEREIFY